MERPRILLTGFGPFPGVPTNPSAWLAETLAEGLPAPDLHGRIQARIFPTEWQAAALVADLCETLQPHVMIHFGVSEHAKTFRIEHSAHNRTAPRADAGGALPASPVILGEGAGRLDTAFPAAALARHLKTNGVAVVTSHSAGHYLCNFLYYHSLDWALRQSAPPLVLFVHVPPTSGRDGDFTDEMLLRGGQEILRFILAFAGERGPTRAAIHPGLAQCETLLGAEDA
ncbi:MAG TPA: pyroglutamyl-peptidase I [Methyloceanibacter sp.]|jgi:pyroglutamyl-peptidase